MTTPDQDERRIRGILHTIAGGPDAAAAPTAAAAAAVAQPQPARTPNPAPAADWWDDLYADDAQPAAGAQDAQPAADAGDAQPRSRRRMRIPPWWSGQSADLSAPDPEPGEDDDSDLLEDAEADEDEAAADAQPDGPDADADAQPVRKPGPARPKRRRPAARSRTRSRRQSADAPRALVDSPPMRRSLLDAYDGIPPRIRWLAVHLSAAAAGYALGWVNWATRSTAWIADHGALTPTALFLYGVAILCECLRYRTRTWRLLVRWGCAVPIASIVIGAALYGTDWMELELPL